MIIAINLGIALFVSTIEFNLTILLKDSSPATSALTFIESAFADHGQETTLTLYNSSFGSLTSGGGNQVSVFASYELNDNSISGQTINAVMEVYAPNGSLIRTSSYPDGFIAQSSGGVEGLESTIRDPTLQSVTANVTFRDSSKTAVLSNDLRVNLNLAEGTTSATTEVEEDGLGLESESEQDSSPPQQTDQEVGGVEETEEGEEGSEAGEDDDEGQELPIPLFGDG